MRLKYLICILSSISITSDVFCDNWITEFIRAAQDIHENYKTLNDFKEIWSNYKVEQENPFNPPIMYQKDANISKLVSKIEKATNDLKRLVPTELNSNKYSFPSSDFNCRNSEKINAYLQYLKSTRDSNNTYLKYNKYIEAHVINYHNNLNDLKSIADYLLKFPSFGEAFQDDWRVVNTELETAISDYSSCVKRNKKIINSNIEMLNVQIDNYENNVKLLTKDCVSSIIIETSEEPIEGNNHDREAQCVSINNKGEKLGNSNIVWSIVGGELFETNSYTGQTKFRTTKQSGKVVISAYDKVSKLRTSKEIKIRQHYIFDVNAQVPITSEIYVQNGDVIDMSSWGDWCWSSDDCCNANGTSGRPKSDENPVTCPGQNFGVLIMKIGNGSWRRLGTSNSFTVSESGALSFWMNDRVNWYNDDHGKVHIDIKVTPH